MEIKRIIGGWLESNCYIIYDEKTREGYIIDPGYEKKKYVEFVEKKNIHPLGVLLTHHHSDHSGEAGGVKSMLGCPILIHEKDAGILESKMSISPDVLLCDGDELALGEEKIKVLKTPGHTMGSVCSLQKRAVSVSQEIQYSMWTLEEQTWKMEARLQWHGPLPMWWTCGRMTYLSIPATVTDAPWER